MHMNPQQLLFTNICEYGVKVFTVSESEDDYEFFDNVELKPQRLGNLTLAFF